MISVYPKISSKIISVYLKDKMIPISGIPPVFTPSLGFYPPFLLEIQNYYLSNSSYYSSNSSSMLVKYVSDVVF